MTGFGTCTQESPDLRAMVEVRSVNHRFLKVLLKVPPTLGSLEADLEGLVRSKLRRGALTMQVRLWQLGGQKRWGLDVDVIRGYLENLKQLDGEPGCGASASDRLALVMGLPGVVSAQEETDELDQSQRSLVLGVAQEAVQDLLEARTREGEHLKAQIVAHGHKVAQLIERARNQAAAIPGEYRQKLTERVRRLMRDADVTADVCEQDLLRETCLMADRLDVTEELERLEGHVQALSATLDAGQEVGRKLDFLLQEFNREANTMGSKANDRELAQTVVELKCEIERIREQVQNLE